MIEITNAAADHLKSIADANEDKQKALKLVKEAGTPGVLCLYE